MLSHCHDVLLRHQALLSYGVLSMQQIIIFTILLLWLIVSGVASRSISADYSCICFILIWGIQFGLPFLLRPLAWAERQSKPAFTLIVRRRRHIWVHLAPWQPTTDLKSEQVKQFWHSVNSSIIQALNQHRSVVISSHLLTSGRAQRIISHAEKSGFTFRIRTYRMPFTPQKRAVMQLEILFRQWRWRSEFRAEWQVMIIRKTSY